jgi:hypothetical protein
MAYQNVGTPRFYVSWGDYWRAQGFGVFRHHTINPYRTYTDAISENNPNESTEYKWEWQSKIPVGGAMGANFVATLNHNLKDGEFKLENNRKVPNVHLGGDGELLWNYHEIDNGWDNVGQFVQYDSTDGEIIHNAQTEKNNNRVEVVNHPPQHPGFSIFTHDAFDADFSINPNNEPSEYPHEFIQSGYSTVSGEGHPEQFDGTFGCHVWGKYYDMPHSPDLKLKMSIEMDGVKTLQSKGGATLSNASYTKPADWGDMGAWQLGGSSNLRSGRKVWDLSFSYLSDSDVFPVNASTGNFSGNENDDFETNILDGTDFFSVVWNRTMGGHLPFIFQPDAPKYDDDGSQIGGNNNPDQFAIARFDMKSLQYEQVASNVYNVKLKIRESW